MMEIIFLMMEISLLYIPLYLCFVHIKIFVVFVEKCRIYIRGNGGSCYPKIKYTMVETGMRNRRMTNRLKQFSKEVFEFAKHYDSRNVNESDDSLQKDFSACRLLVCCIHLKAK